MSYTKLGEFLRILRIKNHEVMGDTADVLNVKTPFLSAVENGKKKAPAEWEEILTKHYNLSAEEQLELHNAIEDSKTQMKIDLTNSNMFQRKMALEFQRSFEDIDEETAKSIIELLNKGKEN